MTEGSDALSFLSPNYVTHEVQGKALHFYPVSVGLAFKLRTTAKPLSRALGALFSSKNQDYGTTERTIKGENEGEEIREMFVEALSPEIINTRHEQQQKAIDELVETLTSEDSLDVVGEIVMSSLREQFPPNDPNNPPAKEFLDRLPLPTLTEMLMGVAKANKGVFGPLADKMEAISSQAIGKVEERLNQQDPEASTPG